MSEIDVKVFSELMELKKVMEEEMDVVEWEEVLDWYSMGLRGGK